MSDKPAQETAEPRAPGPAAPAPATQSSEAPAEAPAETLYIHVGKLGQQAPLMRFVIETQPEVDEFYKDQWVLGPEGNARYDAGVDIVLPGDVTIRPGELVKVNLKVRVCCLHLFWNWGVSPGTPQAAPCGQPNGYWLVPRSSIAQTAKVSSWADGGETRPQRTLHMPNSPGLMDPGYTGPVIVQIENTGKESVSLKRGDAIVQVASPMLTPAEYCRCKPGSALSKTVFEETARGDGGFGSTGAAGSGAP